MPITEDDIQRWRERAKECRRLAEIFKNAVERGEMRPIADMYERMVKDAEALLKRRSVPSQRRSAAEC